MIGSRAHIFSVRTLCFQPVSNYTKAGSSVVVGAQRLYWFRGLRYSSSHPTPSMETPGWLQEVMRDDSPPPTLYAWKPQLLQHAKSSRVGVQRNVKKRRHADKDDLDKRIFILGVGNIGTLLATSLAKASPTRPPITLLVRSKEHLELWSKAPGLEIYREGVRTRYHDFDVEFWSDEKPPLEADGQEPREAADGSVVRNLIVSTKASEAIPEVDRIRRYLGGSSAVAFTQNGMCKLWHPFGELYNNARFRTSEAPDWLACVITHGVTSVGRFSSNHVATSDLKIGPVHVSPKPGKTSANHLMDQLTRAPYLNATRVSRVELWASQLEKLVVNAAINPLTAILRCTNGGLFADPTVAYVVKLLVYEASLVIIHIIRGNHFPQFQGTVRSELGPDASPIEDMHRPGRFSEERLFEIVRRVAWMTRHNTSSMLQDVLAGRKTEIRHFNGWLLDMASLSKMTTPLNAHQAMVKMVEQGIVANPATIGDHISR